MSAPDPFRPGEYPFADRDFDLIAAMAKQAYGLHLDPGKKPLVYSRLARRLRALGLSSFAHYCRLLEHPLEEGERQRMLAALTTNVTQFFREAHHFAQLEGEVLPPLLRRARRGGRVRLWSAGCSSGQEPYSIAACVIAACPAADRLDVQVLATDVDREMLARAEAGRYEAAELGSLDRARRGLLFDAAEGEGGRIRPELRRLVTFRPLNLTGDWPMPGGFDAIFCRNVAIYFDKPTQQRLWSRLAGQLAPGGVLFIGHSERVTGPAAATLRSAGITAYRRKGDTPIQSKEKPWD